MKNKGSHILTVLAGSILGAVAGGALVGKQYDKHCREIEKREDYFSEFYMLMQQWVRVYQEGHTLTDYFKNNGYRKIAIYGMGEMAYMLLNELEDTEIEVMYFIDKNADNLFAKIDVRKPVGELPPVDLIVVAVIQYYDEIKDGLSEKVSCPIVSLADIVWEV